MKAPILDRIAAQLATEPYAKGNLLLEDCASAIRSRDNEIERLRVICKKHGAPVAQHSGDGGDVGNSGI